VNTVFCNLDIIPNSTIIVLVTYEINRAKIGIGFANLFMLKNEVNFLKHPVFLVQVGRR